MDLGKTPMAGFSNGSREFGIFNMTKPKGCRVDADCGNGLSCDAGLGYLGSKYYEEQGLTLACVDGDLNCNADTMTDSGAAPVPASGLCTDRTSTIWANTAAGRVSSVALVQRVGIRSLTDRRQYTDIQPWLTNKFVNVIARTVNDFAPDKNLRHAPRGYKAATGAGDNRRVFLWGRPGFIGVGANRRTLGVYFAYVNMPRGLDSRGNFTTTPAAVRPALHNSARTKTMPRARPRLHRRGIQSAELHDTVNQMSVAWVDSLKNG